jgi:hypothetical protein
MNKSKVTKVRAHNVINDSECLTLSSDGIIWRDTVPFSIKDVNEYCILEYDIPPRRSSKGWKCENRACIRQLENCR